MPLTHPFANVRNEYNAISFHGDTPVLQARDHREGKEQQGERGSDTDPAETVLSGDGNAQTSQGEPSDDSGSEDQQD